MTRPKTLHATHMPTHLSRFPPPPNFLSLDEALIGTVVYSYQVTISYIAML